MLNHQKTPLFDALKSYVNQGVLPFHVPAHKQGRGGDAEFLEYIGSGALGIDLTVIPELDNITNPKTAILDAERLAAEAFGAAQAYFLCNGTTSGIQAMIIAACRPGDKLLVPRNAHKSVIGGIILSGAEPIYLQPEINEHMGIAMGVTVETVQRALVEHADASALFLINPTYFGAASDLRSIVEQCHRQGVLVLVDEAHGGHFYFHEELPLTAMAAGADIAAVSTHKFTGSLTQPSLLLRNENDRISSLRLKSVLNLMQTTSPSYVLLASLDAARRDMFFHGREQLEKTIALARWANSELHNSEGLSFINELIGSPSCYAFDATKLPLCVRGVGLTGHEFAALLRQDWGVQVELSDVYNILPLLTIGDDIDTTSKLVMSIRQVIAKHSRNTMLDVGLQLPGAPPLVVSPRFAYYAETVSIPLEEAEGEVSAEMIMAYPPGIPVICPGERITWEAIRYVATMREAKLNIQGTEDPDVLNLRVLRRNLERYYTPT